MYCELCKRKPKVRLYYCDKCNQPVCDQCYADYRSKCGVCRKGFLK